MIHVSCKKAYTNFMAFLHIFCMYVDTVHVFFSFRQPNAGHMALPTGTKWQCHNTCGPACMVNIKAF